MLLRKSIVTFLYVFSFSIATSFCFAQKRHLELKNIVSNKVRKIEENEKIIVYTEKLKAKGRLKILDRKTIMIEGKIIKIENITKIESGSSNRKAIRTKKETIN